MHFFLERFHTLQPHCVWRMFTYPWRYSIIGMLEEKTVIYKVKRPALPILLCLIASEKNELCINWILSTRKLWFFEFLTHSNKIIFFIRWLSTRCKVAFLGSIVLILKQLVHLCTLCKSYTFKVTTNFIRAS